MEKFKYKFVNINVKPSLKGYLAEDDYEEVVHLHAKSGWRLHSIFSPTYKPADKKFFYQLIFEKQVVD